MTVRFAPAIRSPDEGAGQDRQDPQAIGQGNRTCGGGKDLILSNASLDVEFSFKAEGRLSEENDPALELLVCDCPGPHPARP